MGTFFAPPVGLDVECLLALPVALRECAVEGCFAGLLHARGRFGRFEQCVEGVDEETLVAHRVVARAHSLARRRFRRAVRNCEHDGVAGAVADAFGALGEDAEVPLARGFVGDRETGHVL